jgi:hypothetical protein
MVALLVRLVSPTLDLSPRRARQASLVGVVVTSGAPRCKKLSIPPCPKSCPKDVDAHLNLALFSHGPIILARSQHKGEHVFLANISQHTTCPTFVPNTHIVGTFECSSWVKDTYFIPLLPYRAW